MNSRGLIKILLVGSLCLLIVLPIPCLLPSLVKNSEALENDEETSAGETNIKGNIGFEFKGYLIKPEDKKDYNLAGAGEFETTYLKDALFAKLLLEGLYDTREEERNFFRANEAYVQYDFEDQDITWSLGRQVRFWGALEVYNPVDVIDTQDLSRDPFNVFKIGSYLTSFAKYFDSSGIELIVKVFENNQPFPGPGSPYYIFPSQFVYDKDLITEESEARPTLFLKYSGSTDTLYPLDYSLAISNGYDKQRVISLTEGNTLRQNAYIASKLMTFDTLVINATLLKLEASYTDVKDNTFLSDYIQVGAGVEHTLEQIYQGWDLGLIAEYYLYKVTDSEKLDDLRLFQSFQNDLFLGARLSFNDVASSEIIGGGIMDLEYTGEFSLYAKFKTRIFDKFIVDADARYIHPNTENEPTVFKLMEEHLRMTLNFKYFF